MIIIMTTAITYTTFSMNQVTQLAESVETKQVNDYQRTNESFEVVKVRNDNNRFNMTIVNTGDLPVHLNRLWIENTTDSTFPISKFDLDISIPPGASVKNIGQNIDLSLLDSQSYYAQLISERGNQKQLILNSAADSSLFMRLTATPSVMPTTFATTVTLEVINTGTTQLLNLQPNMVSVTTPTCNDCTFNEIGTVNPAAFDSLSPGDTALFEWVYDFEGTNGDQITFSAGLLNDGRTDETTVTLQTIESALNAEVSLESGGLGDQVLIDDSIILFHMETDATPAGEYQMWSGLGDGGGNGDRISLHNEVPHFLTNNGSNPVTIPEGDWNVAMMLKSDPVPNSLDLGGGDRYDMIFHFEDGDGGAPANSEGRSQLDLEECGVTSYNQLVSIASDDAEERVSNGQMTMGSTDLDMPYSGNNEQINAVRFQSVNVVQGTTINSAIVEFVPDRNLSDFVSLRIFGESTADAATFTSSTSDISSRNDTVAYVDWLNIPAWSDNTVSTATRTPDLSPVIQEIVDRPDWVSGNDIVLMFYNQGTAAGDRREAHTEESDRSAPRLTMTWGSGAVPDWQDGTGPHSSGSYYFDGVQDCFRSAENVQGGNNLGSEEMSTALWFKTDGPVSSESYLVAWEGATDYYRIGLDNVGRVFFEYATSSGSDFNRLVTSAEYDDDIWHHVTVTLDTNPDSYSLVIHELNGDSPESLSGSTSRGTSSIDVSGQWHVAGNVAEDGFFFKGWIDDIIHWDDHKLIQQGQTQQIGDISKTNYGTGAHQFELSIDLEDANGNFVSSIYFGTHNVAFADSFDRGDNDDLAYSQTNMTTFLPETVIGEDQRIDVSFEWLDSTATWESLDVDMKIDDTTMNNPYPSFLQVPYPDRAFASYYVHDQDDEFRIFVTNTGTDGVFFTYQGTRVNFNGTLGSYAGLIHSVNGTGGGGGDWWNMNEDRDSLHVPPGENAEMYFHEATDIPSTDESGTLMPAGIYKTTIWINGYSDQGETFSRAVVVGSVTVTP